MGHGSSLSQRRALAANQKRKNALARKRDKTNKAKRRNLARLRAASKISAFARKRGRSKLNIAKRKPTKRKPTKRKSTKRKSTKRKPTAKVRKVSLTRAKRKGASRVVGLRVRRPTVPVKTRTAGRKVSKTQRDELQVSISRAPSRSRRFIVKGKKGTTMRGRGGQGQARTKPRINQDFVPRDNVGDPFVEQPEIQNVGGSFSGQAGDFVKGNKLIVAAGIGLVVLMVLKR